MPTFGQNEDEVGIEMAGKAGLLAVRLPVVVVGCLVEFPGKIVEIRAGGIGGKVLFVENGFGPGNVWDEAADATTVDADGGLFRADDVGQIEAVSFKERLAQKRPGDFEADVLEVGAGC